MLILGWILFARSENENISSNGFNSGGGGGTASAYSSERRAQTGLSFVGRSDAASPIASAPASAAAATAAPAPASADAAPPPDPKEMAAAGVPTDAAGLRSLGSDSGLLTGAISRLLDHPRVLRALLDNRIVVAALMDRQDSKRNCSDAGALQAGLSSPGAGAYESKMMPLISAALARPDAVAAMAGSEMGSRLMACPSVKALANNPAGLMAIAAANTPAVAMVSDPRVAQALSTSVQGASLLGGVQSSLGGGSAP
ncbi:MAG: hypothetical protein ACHQ2Z_06100 [Elusimicrobiota bacterium]